MAILALPFLTSEELILLPTLTVTVPVAPLAKTMSNSASSP